MIKIIDKNERLVWRFPLDKEAGFYYRRVPDTVREELRAKCTNDGKLDTEKFGDEILHYAVLGWFGIIDEDKNPVEFKHELLPYLPTGLTSPFNEVLLEGLEAEKAEKAEKEKN